MKELLVVEDEPRLVNDLKRMLGCYPIEIHPAGKASEAWPFLFSDASKQRPDALILDMMLQYGSDYVRRELDPNRADVREIDTGLSLLRKLREEERQKGWPPLWVAATTARSAPRFVREIEMLTGSSGKVFLKPYDPAILEMALCEALGLPCQVPAWMRPQSRQ